MAAIVGHIYPVWLHFRGGKGVATACGVFSMLTPAAVAPALAVFVSTVWITKYVSLGSVLASLALPPIAYATGSPCACGHRRVRRGALIVFRHRSNVVRLRTGTERRLGAQSLMRTMAVLGAGSWGTALAVHLARRDTTSVCGRATGGLVDEMRVRRANAVYLPDVTLPEGVSVTCDAG